MSQRSCLRLLPVLLLCQTLIAQQPEFVSGDVSKLSCRTLSVEKLNERVERLEVEVRNRGSLHAEPLSFVVHGPKRRGKAARSPGDQGSSRFDLARMPLVGRFGAAIPPRGKRRYWINSTALAGRRSKVELTMACFHRGFDEPVRQPSVQLLAPTRGRNDFTGKTHDLAQFRIENPLPRAADVWLLAEFVRPTRSQELLAYRVRANGKREVELGVRPPVSGFEDSGTAYAVDVELKSLKVLHWLAIGDIDHGSARKAFLEACRNWAIWPANVEQVTARFKTTERGKDMQTGRDLRLELSGTVRVGPDRRVELEMDQASSRTMQRLRANGLGFSRSGDKGLVRDALRFLCRRTASELEREAKFRWVTPSSVQLLGTRMLRGFANVSTAGADGLSSSAPRFGLLNGRIVRDGMGANTSNDWLWQTAKLGDLWVQTERHFEVPHSSNIETETWEHALESGIPVLRKARYLVLGRDGTISDQRMEFRDWSFRFRDATADERRTEPAQQDEATGAGVAQLREAWARLHRWPGEPLRWKARIKVDTSGTDGSWQGHHRFAAGIEVTGITGKSIRLDMGGKTSTETEAQLGSVILDRLGMWFGSDPQAMAPFDELFAGAEIARRNGTGWHRIEGHRFARVRVQDGLLREIVYATGLHRRFHYEKVDETQVITRIERDVARKTEVRIGLKRVGKVLMPERFEFLRIFGADWGPESFELTELRLVD